MKETTEYRLVKQLTAQENRARVKLAIIGAMVGGIAIYSAFMGFLYFLLWFNDKVDQWV